MEKVLLGHWALLSNIQIVVKYSLYDGNYIPHKKALSVLKFGSVCVKVYVTQKSTPVALKLLPAAQFSCL